ncbi:MAG: hypothetical protein ABJH45_23755 [Paracoccaceae bacterium]
MNTRKHGSVFLERRSYRRRRMMDAIRLLPGVGVMLWMLPLFWSATSETVEPVRTSTAITYVFGVWVLLILIGLGLWSMLTGTVEIGGSNEDAPHGPTETQ